MTGIRRGPGIWLLAVLVECGIGASLPAAEQPLMYRFRQEGSGGPVVVFENGLGAGLATWNAVQDEASRFTETFSYNRAGYDGSPAGSGTRDAATVVGELRALLAERGLSPPYVLVGHSLGGLFMQYYARNFPDEVAGLVLVDSSHWDQLNRMRRAFPEVAARAIEERNRSSGITGMESDAFDMTGREVSSSPPLRPMPFIVLSAGRQPEATAPPSTGSNVRTRRGITVGFWLELQRELAGQLPEARHTIVRRSGHFIQLEQPQYVWAAVRDIVEDVRGQ